MNGIFINLYTPSSVQWTQSGVPVTLTQETEFPASDRVTIHVNPASPSEFSIQLRIPSWATQATLSINGKFQTSTLNANTVLPLKRLWRSGDRIDLVLPQAFRTEAIDELHPGTVALMRGPVEYVGLNQSAHPINKPSSSRPKLRNDLKAVTQQAFTSADTTFIPLYSVESETYDTYFET